MVENMAAFSCKVPCMIIWTSCASHVQTSKMYGEYKRYRAEVDPAQQKYAVDIFKSIMAKLEGGIDMPLDRCNKLTEPKTPIAFLLNEFAFVEQDACFENDGRSKV